VTDWTLIVTTLGTASITGGLGYLVAKRNGDVALRGIEAENDRLREQHREDHFRNRQGTYHNFLNVDRALRYRLALSGKHRSAEEIVTLFTKLDETYNGVILFGSPRVIETIEPVLEYYRGIPKRAEELGDTADALSKAIEQTSEALDRARNDLLKAMRDDVGYRPPPSSGS
jgi:hypothetical protein